MFFLPYVIGRIMGPSINALFTNPKKASEIVKKEFLIQRKELRKFTSLGIDDEKALNESLYVSQGMVEAYRVRYGKFLAEAKVLKHEAPFHYTGIGGVVIVGKLDNIILSRKKEYVHELKTTASLTPSSIRSIKTKMQPAMYKYLTRRIKGFGHKIVGVLYDIIRKPGIRPTQKETYREYLLRLRDWYVDGSENKFHLERTHTLEITEDALMNTVIGITDQMKRNRMEQDAYYQNFQWCCPDRGIQCDMYELCHGDGGEDNPEILAQYRKKQPYKVEKGKKP